MSRGRAAIGGRLCGAMLALAAATAVPASERVVADPLTGLAIGGYDPVAYYVEGRAVPGAPEHEVMRDRVVWRFANEGNREAFRLAADTYAPRYGGHCAYAVSRAEPAEGRPTLWAIHEGRLYLFFSPAHRTAFLLEPARTIAAADAVWPKLAAALAN